MTLDYYYNNIFEPIFGVVLNIYFIERFHKPLFISFSKETFSGSISTIQFQVGGFIIPFLRFEFLLDGNNKCNSLQDEVVGLRYFVLNKVNDLMKLKSNLVVFDYFLDSNQSEEIMVKNLTNYFLDSLGLYEDHESFKKEFEIKWEQLIGEEVF